MTEQPFDPLLPAGDPVLLLREQQREKKRASEFQKKIDAINEGFTDSPIQEEEGRQRVLRAAEGKRAKEVGYSNPRFDPRIEGWNHSLGATLFRGYMVQAKESWKDTGQSEPFRLNFLYNPSYITVTYSSNDSVLPNHVLTGLQQAASALIPNMQQVTFNLQFDRSYEVYDQVGPEPRGRAKKLSTGVYADISALERLVGINSANDGYLGGQGPILPLPLYVFFGDPNLNRKPLGYYGYINEITVEYSHFGANMTPIRALVGIGFTQLVKNAEGGIVDPTTTAAPETTGEPAVTAQ